jgi:5-formyltetrahydrofolate cyclo-ligase
METNERESVRAEKARLRLRFQATRLALSEGDYAARSAAIRARLLRLPEIETARTVHVYWPVVDRREVDIRPLVSALHARGVRVLLPIVVPRTADTAPRLRSARFEGEDQLRRAPFGLFTGAPDVVIVPALGAGRNGHRIGYGAGYYDAFLGGVEAFTVCPIYAACLVDLVPPEPHDRRVDAVVTEDEVIRVAAAQ